MTVNGELRMHPWESCGLGKAPFRCVGSGRETYQAIPGDPNCPIQPGTSCDYCGQGISNVAYMKSADGKSFKVGFDCAEKVYSALNKAHALADEDAKARAKLRRERLEMERTKRFEKAKEKKKELEATLETEEMRTKLSALPHPRGFKNRETGEALTLLDWATWMLENAGDKGRREVLKKLKTI